MNRFIISVITAFVFVLTVTCISGSAADTSVDKSVKTGGMSINVNDQTNPIEGATVTIDGVTYTTDAQGNVHAKDLAMGFHNILASAPGYNSESFTTVLTEFMYYKVMSISLTKGENSAVYGSVSDGANPVAYAIVTVANASVMTDVHGFYSVSNVPFGDYTVVVESKDYARDNADITVLKNSVVKQDFSLVKQATDLKSYEINGRITDGANPIANIMVTDGVVTATTDVNGYYSIGRYLEDTQVTLTVNNPSYLIQSENIVMGNTNLKKEFILEPLA